MMGFAYAVANAFAGLPASSYSPLSGPADATRAYLNDGRMDRQYAFTARAASNSVVIDTISGTTSLVGIAVLNHNLASMGGTQTVLIEAADDAGISVNVITPKVASTVSAVAPTNKDSVFQFAATAGRRYWRITFAWTGTQTLKVGEILGFTSSTVLTRGQNDGSGETEHILGTPMTMLYGETRFAFLGGPLREKLVHTSDFSTSNNNELLTLWRATKGPTTPFLWIESYEAVSTAAALSEQDCIFGRLMLPDYAWAWSDYQIAQPPQLIVRSLGREVGA